MDRLTLENGAGCHVPMHAGYAKTDNLCNRTPVGGRAEVLPVELENGNVVGLAEARGTLDHDLQHGLELGRRGADDPQNLGCRRLLLQRLGKPLFQMDPRFADRMNSRTRLRCLRTKTGNASSALRPFARQGHLVGTVTGRSRGASLDHLVGEREQGRRNF